MYSTICGLVSGALNKRLLTVLVTLVIVAAGIFAWTRLSIEAYPELSDPQVRLITLYAGKGAEEVEKLVTVPLEKALYGIPGQTSIRSLSVYGLSVLTITFRPDADSDRARQRTLERLNRVVLPEDVHPELGPDVGSLKEIFRYELDSPYYSTMGLNTIQQWEMEKQFSQIPGVVGVVSQGGPTRSYQVSIDPHELKAYNITLDQVFDALAGSNASSGGGFLQDNGQALVVRQFGLLSGIEDIEKVVIRQGAAGVPIRVGDVARVEVGPLVRRGQVGKDFSDDCVEGIVLLRRGENPSKVLAELKNRLPRIKASLPTGVSMRTLYDRCELIESTLHTIGKNVLVGISLVFVFLVVFLTDLGAAAITATVIPIAMLMAVLSLLFLNIPANLLSLGAIDFGILVDSAIVMIENIHRRLSIYGADLSPRDRLLLLSRSAREVATPVVAGVVVIIISFLPILSFTGVEGKLFKPLAVTMIAAVIGAGLAALTVIPVLCSFWFIEHHPCDKESWIVRKIQSFYIPSLQWSLSHRHVVSALSTLLVVVAAVIFMAMGSEFLPHLDEGNIWLRTTVNPPSVTLEESVDIAGRIREKLLRFPEVTMVISQAGGPDDGTDPSRFSDQEFLISLRPRHQWRHQFHGSKEKLIASMRENLEMIPNVGFYFTQYIQATLDEALSGVRGSLVAKISGTDLESLERLSKQVGREMASTPGIVDVIVDPILGQPQVSIDIDREAAARYGLNVDRLRSLVEIAIAGKQTTVAIEDEKRFPVMMRLASDYRDSVSAIKQLLIDTPAGVKVPLSQVARIKSTVGATQIWREHGSRLATVRANVSGRDLSSSVADARKKVKRNVTLPSGFEIVWSGEFERQREASRQLTLVLPVTLVAILFLLYLSCGSLRGALTIFCVIPLAVIGAVLALFFTGTYFSIAAGVGSIVLFGLAVKNGILVVTFINELRRKGLSIFEAVTEGAITRMKPVVMTAVIAASGLLPAALSNEIGSQSQRPFAIVIIGGLVSCTILTLYALPVLYLMVAPEVSSDRTIGRPNKESALADDQSCEVDQEVSI